MTVGDLRWRYFHIGCAAICWMVWSTEHQVLIADEPISWEASESQFNQLVLPLLNKHCVSCHGSKEPEGELEILTLNPNMDSPSAARWAMVLGKVAAKEMPPDSERPLPDAAIETLTGWIRAELKRTGKHVAFRETYKNGNSVPHHLLFDAKSLEPLDAAPRVRRLSPSIYERTVIQDDGKRTGGIVQPFSPSANTTFKDMGAPKVDEPTTNALLKNALAILATQTEGEEEGGSFKKGGSTPNEFVPLLLSKLPTDEEIEKAIAYQFRKVLLREPSEEETQRFSKLYQTNRKQSEPRIAAQYSLAAVYLLPDAVFRWEIGSGDADTRGRRRLTPREIAFAISFALTDAEPSSHLLKLAESDALDTDEGVATAVREMLADEKLNKPAILRFFQEYFDYPKAVEVFKDSKEGNFHKAQILVADTDRLIESVLEQDKQVLYELLTTNKSFVEYKAAAEKKEQREKALAEFLAKKKQEPEKYKDKEPKLPHASTYESYNEAGFSAEQPVTLPANQRAGILTQPAWLVAFSKSDENDAIHRGKWVRERLLGGVVPDIPITVDAQLPENPEMTLRERMHVTEDEYCWKCHTYMNRLGLPFEMYDHFGRFRETETVLDLEATAKNVDAKGKHQGDVMKNLQVDATGGFEHVPGDALQGDVSNAVEMMKQLAESEYVEQVFVRHAFRYWLGRNETVGDAASLQAVHRAYRESDGSMNELIAALLSSESFLYRVP